MDWFFKAVSTASAVLLVMAAARQCGPRLAGVLAALPTVTAPALGWLAHDQGVAPAISAAIASVSVCAMLAAFALAYAVAARRAGPVVALLCGVGGAATMTLPALAAGSELGTALLLAGPCTALACLVMPRSRTSGVPLPCSSRRMMLMAAATGALAALAATLGPAFGATGLVASLPLIGGGVAVMAHVASGHRAASQFLRGYVWGLFAKIVFGAVFVLAARHVGAGSALVLAGEAIVDARHDETSQARFRIVLVRAGVERRIHPDRAMASAERALAIARRRPPDNDLLRALHVLGDAALFDKSFARARGAYRELVAVATAHEPLGANELSLIHEFLGHAERGLGHYADAEESLRRGVELEVRRNANPLRLSESRTHYAIFLDSVGRFRESLEAVEPAWRWGLTASPALPQLPWTRIWYARELAAYGRPQDALAIDDGSDVDPKSGMAEQAWTDRAVALLDVGRLADARAALDRARAVSVATGRPPSPSIAATERRWLVTIGRAGEARAALEAARAVKKHQPMPVVSEPVADQVEAAWLRLESGDPAAADAAATQALAAIANGGIADYQRDHEARATLVLGRALVAQHRERDALPILERAVAMHRAIYAPQSPAVAGRCRRAPRCRPRRRRSPGFVRQASATSLCGRPASWPAAGLGTDERPSRRDRRRRPAGRKDGVEASPRAVRRRSASPCIGTLAEG